MTDTKADSFEVELHQDLPRGLAPPASSGGPERGVSSWWISAKDMVGKSWDHARGLVMLGRRGGRVIGYSDNRHLLTIAGSRAGKGVSLIIPNLIFYPGSVVVVDPKGENAARTARRRGKSGPKSGAEGLGQEVFVLDPFGESGLEKTQSFNPVTVLDPQSDLLIEDVSMFADALIMHPERGERHWTESAQALIRSLLLAVVLDPRFKDRRNLITVRKLLMLTDESIGRLVEDDSDVKPEGALMQILLAQGDNERFGHVPVGVARQILAMGDNERGSVLSSARTQTQWLDSPMMERVLTSGPGELDMRKLKSTALSIYLCLPASRMATHSRWLRLVILLALNVMERDKTDPDWPVLFVLDEFPVLGFMEAIETAAGLMAGYKVMLWVIVQNLGQLKRHYEKSWQTFVANSGVVTAFSVSDKETLDVLSDYLGQTAIIQKSARNLSGSELVQGGYARVDERRESPLLAPHELRLMFRRKKGRALVFNVEENPAVVQRFVYYEPGGMFHDASGRPLYDPDPKYEVKP